MITLVSVWSRYKTLIKPLFALLFLVAARTDLVSAQVPLPPNTYQLSIHSQPGDPWGVTTGKSDWLYNENDGQFICRGFDWIGDRSMNHLTFLFYGNNGDFWHMAFTAGGELTPGVYEGGLDLGGLGRGCLTSTGKFTILDIAYEGSGNSSTIKRFAATFEFHCYRLPPALTGVILFNSNGIPPPSTLLIKPRAPMPDAVVGSGYSEKIEVEGGTPPYLWATNMGQLPPGLTLDTTGTISGVPTTHGRYSFRISVTDSALLVNGYPSQVGQKDFSITVNPAGFSIEDGLPPTGALNAAYAFQFTAIGGTEPYGWQLIEGNLPAGLVLANDGKLSGAPSSVGVFTFTLRANDSAGHQSDQRYTIKVIDPPRIDSAAYKAKKARLIVYGVKFDAQAILLIDGEQIKPKSQDHESFVVKGVSLSAGTHNILVVNPDSGSASVTINIP